MLKLLNQFCAWMNNLTSFILSTNKASGLKNKANMWFL